MAENLTEEQLKVIIEVEEKLEGLHDFVKELRKAEEGMKQSGESMKKMQNQTQELSTKITFLSRTFDAMKKALSNSLSAVKSSVLSLQNGIVSLANKAKWAFMLVVATTGLIGKQMLEAASNAEEAGSKLSAVFQNSTDNVKKTMDVMKKELGVGYYSLQEEFGNIGAIFRGLGLDAETSAKQTEKAIRLAYDLASFHNLGMEQAVAAVRSGMLGETESLKSNTGIILLEDQMKEYAKTLGIAWNDISQAEKAQLRLNYAFEQAQKQGAIGDLERTSGSYANQLRRLQGNLNDLKTKLGEALLPVVTKLITVLNNIDWSKFFSSETATKIKNITIGVIAVTGAIAGIGLVIAALSNPLTLVAGAFIAFYSTVEDGAEKSANFIEATFKKVADGFYTMFHLGDYVELNINTKDIEKLNAAGKVIYDISENKLGKGEITFQELEDSMKIFDKSMKAFEKYGNGTKELIVDIKNEMTELKGSQILLDNIQSISENSEKGKITFDEWTDSVDSLYAGMKKLEKTKLDNLNQNYQDGLFDREVFENSLKNLEKDFNSGGFKLIKDITKEWKNLGEALNNGDMINLDFFEKEIKMKLGQNGQMVKEEAYKLKDEYSKALYGFFKDIELNNTDFFEKSIIQVVDEQGKKIEKVEYKLKESATKLLSDKVYEAIKGKGDVLGELIEKNEAKREEIINQVKDITQDMIQTLISNFEKIGVNVTDSLLAPFFKSLKELEKEAEKVGTTIESKIKMPNVYGLDVNSAIKSAQKQKMKTTEEFFNPFLNSSIMSSYDLIYGNRDTGLEARMKKQKEIEEKNIKEKKEQLEQQEKLTQELRNSVERLFSNLATLTGNDSWNKIGSGIDMIWEGIDSFKSIDFSKGFSMANLTAGMNVAGAAMGVVSTIDSYFSEKQEKENQEQIQQYTENTSALTELTTKIQQLNESLVQFDRNSIQALALNPTSSNVEGYSKNYQIMLDAISQNKDFGDVSVLADYKYKDWKFKTKHKKKEITLEDELLAALGGYDLQGQQVEDLSFEQLKEYRAALSSIDESTFESIAKGEMSDWNSSQWASLGISSAMSGLFSFLPSLFGIGDSKYSGQENNFDEYLKNIDEYIAGVERLQKAQEDLQMNAILENFEGINVIEQQQLIEQYTEQLEEAYKTFYNTEDIEEYRAEIEETAKVMAENADVMVTAMNDVRSATVSAMNGGKTAFESFVTGVQTWTEKIQNNVSQMTYNIQFGGLDEQGEDVFRIISERLATAESPEDIFSAISNVGNQSNAYYHLQNLKEQEQSLIAQQTLLQQSIDDTVQAYLYGGMSLEEYNSQYKILYQSLERVEQQLANTSSEVENFSENTAIYDWFTSIAEAEKQYEGLSYTIQSGDWAGNIVEGSQAAIEAMKDIAREAGISEETIQAMFGQNEWEKAAETLKEKVKEATTSAYEAYAETGDFHDFTSSFGESLYSEGLTSLQELFADTALIEAFAKTLFDKEKIQAEIDDIMNNTNLTDIEKQKELAELYSSAEQTIKDNIRGLGYDFTADDITDSSSSSSANYGSEYYTGSLAGAGESASITYSVTINAENIYDDSAENLAKKTIEELKKATAGDI